MCADLNGVVKEWDTNISVVYAFDIRDRGGAGSIPAYLMMTCAIWIRLFFIANYYFLIKGWMKNMISSRNRGRYKLKCQRCHYINFYDREEVCLDGQVRYIVCESCGKKIELKKHK